MPWSLDRIPIDDLFSSQQVNIESMTVLEQKEGRTAQAHFGSILSPRNENLDNWSSLL